ncbi:hypothetical protein H2198_010803 [Neophaeococcomyces mojaviensis]|uniref:Uncharacterized protein n=1 Tax=Neophaeococcomyces mojaviensis TaxID=3383035 RepID=A0ACC2ZQM2_9EURO|nr:hypothetical protein H2198_010803 [Knufia sp. JES_112]
MSHIGAPQQHKQSSRKGKKAWRKNVDVTDVQEGLEEYREEVRAGGPLREKKSEDIFALDTVGSTEITKKYNLQKPLKVDEILAQRSAVPAVDSRKRAGRDAPSGIYEPASKRRKGDWVSRKDVQRLKKTINAVSHLQSDADAEEPALSFDLWDAPPEAPKTSDLEYIPKPRTKVAPGTIKRAPVALTASGKPVKAVRNPAGGSSYNPDFDEWNEVIVREGDKEVAAEKARLQAAQEEAERQARIAAVPEDDLGARTDDESAWEGFETENDETETLRKKRPTRKTPAERNKFKRRKDAERQAKHEARMAGKRKQIQDLAVFTSGDLVAADEGGNLAVEKHGTEADGEDDESGDDRVLRRRKMGNATIPEKSLEVVLPDELQESLRLLKPEGNLLQDRFRNLLVNGKVESRKPVLQPKKKRVKFTEKWSFKDFEIQV